jgi:hypothetical protein
LFQDRCFARSIAGAGALMMLLWVGAMSPHLVHHLFDEDHAQVCLMSEQAGQFPGLMVVQPSLALPPTPPLGFPVLPLFSPREHRTATSLSRAPPCVRA